MATETASNYLTTSAAASTYLTQANAASTYYPLTGNPSGFLVSGDLSGYLLSSTAASTYQPIGSYAVTNSGNTFTASQIISVTDNSNAALRITQLGTGEAFRVEDSANPDSTPFVITAAGNVGIGTATPATGLSVAASYDTTFAGTNNFTPGIAGRTAVNVTCGSTITAPGINVTYGGSNNAVIITNGGTGASLRVNDETSDTTPFIVDAGGNVGVKTASPSTDFEVNGNAKFTTGNITSAPAAGDSSSLIPTTAWVQSEVPSASTTTAGKVELAIASEAEAKSSSTLAATPASLLSFVNAPQWAIPDISGSTAVVATGTTTVGSAGVRLVLTASGSASGQYAARYFGSSSNATVPHFLMRGEQVPSLDKRILLAARVRLNTVANAVQRFTFGKLSSGAVGDLGAKGFGFKVDGTGALLLQVHDGTTLTNVTSSFTPTSQSAFDVIIENVGNGTVNLIVNDSQVATSSAGGTGDYTVSTIPTVWIETELTGSIATNSQFMINNIYLGTVS